MSTSSKEFYKKLSQDFCEKKSGVLDFNHCGYYDKHALSIRPSLRWNIIQTGDCVVAVEKDSAKIFGHRIALSYSMLSIANFLAGLDSYRNPFEPLFCWRESIKQMKRNKTSVSIPKRFCV
jgi:hypothetical protein